MFNLRRFIALFKKTLLFLIIGLTPLVFYPSLANAFQLPKIICFKILILLTLFCFITGLLIAPKEKLKSINQLLFGLNHINLLVIVANLFFLIIFLAHLFSAHFHLSWTGLMSRQMGAETYLYFFVFFWLVILSISDLREILFIFKIISFTVFLVSGYGLLQVLGLDPINWIENTKVRVISSFGQPNFFAGWLLLTLPLVFYLSFSAKKRLWRLVYFFIFALGVVNIFLTYSLSAWLGLAAGIFVSFLFCQRALFRRKNIILFLSAIIIVGGLMLYFNGQQKQFLEQKISSLTGLGPESTLVVRFNLWQAAKQAFFKKIIWGYGPDVQGEALFPYYQKNWALFSQINVQPTRAHNIFLDILLISGVAGLSVYLFLLLLVFVILRRNIQTGKNKERSLIFLIALVSYFVFLFFNFSTISTELYFWLYLAVIILISKTNTNSNRQNILADTKQPKKNFLSLGIIVLILVLAMFLGRQIRCQFKNLLASYYWRQALISRHYNRFFEARVFYEYITDLKINDIYYRKNYLTMLISWLPEIEYFGKGYQKVVTEFYLPQLYSALGGNRFNDYILRARVFTLLSNNNKKYLPMAEKNLDYALQQSPERPNLYRFRANIKAASGEFSVAYQDYYSALSRIPFLEQANAQHREAIKYELYLIYRDLGDLFRKQKKWLEAEKYYLLAQKNNIKNYNVYHRLAVVAEARQDIKKAIWYNKEGLGLAPAWDWSWPLELARLYKELGDSKQAKFYAQKVLDYYPENQEAREIMDKRD